MPTSSSQQKTGTSSGSTTRANASLFDRHLQPPSAPSMATNEQLEMLQTIINTRMRELHVFNEDQLKVLFEFMQNPNDNPNIRKEISTVLTSMPHKAPKNKNQYLSFIRYLLVGQLHRSLDEGCSPSYRTAALDAAKFILKCIDDCPSRPKKAPRISPRSIGEKDSTDEVGKASISHNTSNSKRRAPMAVIHESEIVVLDDDDEDDSENNQKPPASKTSSVQQSSMARTSLTQQSSLARKSSAQKSSVARKSSGQQSSVTRPSSTQQTSMARSSSTQQSSSEASLSHKVSSQSGHSTVSANAKVPPMTQKPLSNHDRAKRKPPMNVSKLPAKQRTRRQNLPFALVSKSPKPALLRLQFQKEKDAGMGGYSESLKGRDYCMMQVPTGIDRSHENPPVSTTSTNGSDLDDMDRRFEKWDPFWRLRYDCSVSRVHNEYLTGCKTVRVYGVPYDVQSACRILAYIPPDSDFSHTRTSNAYKDGDRRLLIRSLEIRRAAKYVKERADTHQWPKGTFIQVNDVPRRLLQRKQQSHDESLWKGMSHMFDITEFVSDPLPRHQIDICTKDSSPYYFQVAICDYMSPDSVFRTLMGRGEKSIDKLTYNQGHVHAMKYANVDTVVLDSDSDDDNGKSDMTEKITLSFSLLCPISMAVIKTPVRGKSCKHLQCFDLMNYLKYNSSVCGGRWRCGVCENFVAAEELIFDGMMAEMLNTYGHLVDGSRDKIQFSSDGEWTLMNENRIRHRKKRSAEESVGGDGSRTRTGPTPSNTVVISLD